MVRYYKVVGWLVGEFNINKQKLSLKRGNSYWQ